MTILAARLRRPRPFASPERRSVGYVVVMGRLHGNESGLRELGLLSSHRSGLNGSPTSPRAKMDYGSLRQGLRPTPRSTFQRSRLCTHGVAPLNEQRRIVGKLDAIFEQTRAARARLERLPALLTKFKRSILAAALPRRPLGQYWRVAHPDVEPASELLDRIRTEHRRRWESRPARQGQGPQRRRPTRSRSSLITERRRASLLAGAG